MDTDTTSKSLFEADKKLVFITLCLGTFLLLFSKKTFIEHQTAAFEFLVDRPEGSLLQLISTLQYFSIPLVYLWKFVITSFIIWLGAFLFGYRVTYSQCWSIVLGAEFIFFIPEALKIGWFTLFNTDPDLLEIRAFYPFSLMNLFNHTQIDTKYAYPLKALNLFELIYWLSLSRGIQLFIRKNFMKAFQIIVSTYGVLFLLWLVFYAIVYR